MNPGCIVRCRNRDWVLLPSDDEELYHLRPLTGATDEVVVVHKQLAELVGYELPEERLRSATFPLPTENDVADAASAHLLWQATRLTLREGAAPFRSLGRTSVRPRVYQFVPLLMALRLDPIRLLIADDVGVGKTIEALLIAREMLDRGEIKRLCVLCPPYLCEQWQKELAEKFNLDAVVIRAGTVGQLDRRKVGPDSIYRYYPVQVASIDFLKSDRNKHTFLLDCPEMVIVDEAHGSAAADNYQGQHQRNQLVRELAAKEDRHLILLTATPHSGFESAFRSLLSLLRPEFGGWNMASLTEPERVELARHFVQRTRRDIEKDWEGEHCFPKRESIDETYRLSRSYRDLFEKTHAFCSEIVRSGLALGKRQQRVRYWAALALLRCVMSSPAAAVAALESRRKALAPGDEEPDFRTFIFESAEEQTDDELPTPPIECAEATLDDPDRHRLRELGRMAKVLLKSTGDTKLAGAAKLVETLLLSGFHPIVWCRYIATAEYVAERLQDMLRKAIPDLRVAAITGRMGDEERRAKVEELSQESCRVLVATDCLSEGVNLQDGFSAVLHYDLPWNPNRLEQREGRVDRYGQKAKIVKAIRYFSPDSAVDGVVLDVLLNKAREIHRALGTHVPVPDESETVTEALVNALFLRGGPRTSEVVQLGLFPEEDLKAFHGRWDLDADRERVNRTRFAQRALKPDEVRRELEATDKVLGDADAVREFVLAAAQRLGLNIARDKRTDGFRVAVDAAATAALPPAVVFALPSNKTGHWLITFTSPSRAEGAEYLGRNHRFVASLARFLMEESMTKDAAATAARCGVVRTRAVLRLTTVLMLRVRYLLTQPDRAPLLAEEVVVMGFVHGAKRGARDWLADDEALRLLAEARPDANIPLPEKRHLIAEALADWPVLEAKLHKPIGIRAAELERSHKRVRQAVALKVRQLTVAPQFPPDLLGILMLQPVV
jgi:superfamily II DNA or RNA helicase